MLELCNVSKRFPGILAVDDVSFQAHAGEITGYLGPNGSGKSTTTKMITGLIETTSGKIFFDGQPIRSDLLGFKQGMGGLAQTPFCGVCDLPKGPTFPFQPISGNGILSGCMPFYKRIYGVARQAPLYERRNLLRVQGRRS
jgi:ABC-type cobalamin/Fe3+-siderophores transport system ATPase subunit